MNFVTNRQLFSAVYLRELQQGKHAADVLDGARQTIREWRAEYADLADSATCMAYVKQCLSALGVTSSLRPEHDGFTLYADTARTQVTGLCLVMAADADIGRTVKGHHPQAHLVRELRQASAQWGILTNGATWRLCFAAAPAPYEVWLEVGLDGLLSESGLQEFLLFQRFFGGEAFAVTGDQVGLARFLAESDRRTEAIERHLKSHVEPILQKLCLGFVQDEAAQGYDAESLQVIYQNAIYLLYRILFLFYAEARGLLPVESEAYRPAGLAALVETARQREQEGVTAADPFSLWRRLTRLCVVVDDGDDELGVAAYNGGLFSDLEKPYLKRHQIRDEYLAPALFTLGYEGAGQRGEGRGRGGGTASAAPLLIDYRDLSVRHLGTLYEGLLEYRLNLVEHEPRVVRESGGKRVYIPMSAASPVKKGETILEVGEVYFADDKGERKASGSYYTPEDVVQYIVGNTVTPKLEERRKAFDAVRVEVERERAIAATPEQRRQLELYADRQALETVDLSLLRLRILDPAMGSGHFLVAAAQTVTDFIIETLNATAWPNEEITTDPLFWKRRVVERCIYGVDKNPLAHELAKLSLWIASASAGKPLTFLDHHLKCGNSLYGTPLSRLATLPGRPQREEGKGKGDDGLFRLAREEMIADALKQLAGVTQTDSDTIATVKQKEVANKTAGKTVQRLRMVADLWLATLFGLKTEGDRAITAEEYNGFLHDLSFNLAEEAWEYRVRNSYILQQAERIAAQNSFFHWELEFPDSVVNGECRFDAVIANPPYVGTKANAAITVLYETAKCGDLYAWIFEKALQVTADLGNVGTVVPLSLMFSGDFVSLRARLLGSQSHIRLSSHDNVPDSLFNTGKLSDNTCTENMQRTTIALCRGRASQVRIESTSLVRWWHDDRKRLFETLRFSDVTAICTSQVFPKIGDERLVEFWKMLQECKLNVSRLSEQIFSEARRPPLGAIFVTVPRIVGYFISATPGSMLRNGVLSVSFNHRDSLDYVRVLLNSNVFFWYWRAFGDGFHLNVDIVGDFPIPKPTDNEYVRLAERLDAATEQCTTFKMYRGEKIPSFNFNKRMDILLDIDEWIVRQVAPDLNLPRDIFAQYKSNSFLRPLDISALSGATDEEEGDL